MGDRRSQALRGRHRGGNHRGRHEDHRPTDAGGTLLRSACFTVKYADGAFQFTVHGFGHGVGMSQYGADYMARQGSTWQEILTHYYTGVTIE